MSKKKVQKLKHPDKKEQPFKVGVETFAKKRHSLKKCLKIIYIKKKIKAILFPQVLCLLAVFLAIIRATLYADYPTF